MTSGTWSRWSAWLWGLAGFALAFVVAYTNPRLGGNSSRAGNDQTLVPEGPFRAKRVIVMVFLGSAHCTASNAPDVRDAIATIKADLRQRAQTRGWSFITIGVARDRLASAGLKHLRWHGGFDEVSAGLGPWNTVYGRYVWRDLPGVAATPQVLVTELSRTDGNELGVELDRVEERLVVRQVGRRAILAYAANGSPIPP